MADGDLPSPRRSAESAAERRIWVGLYVIVLLTLAAGAARRIWTMLPP
jgi:hypothetical protein